MATPFKTFALVLFLAGCATTTPEGLREPDNPIALSEARHDLDSSRGRNVRWGGTIVNITNRAADTQLEVLARPLTAGAQPNLDGQSEGRFLVRFSGFLDPEIYARDREITVVGILQGREPRAIGDFRYDYPVVRAARVHLWPKRPQQTYDNRYPYDPWWPSPWYPWGYPYYSPFPYYGPPYWRY